MLDAGILAAIGGGIKPATVINTDHTPSIASVNPETFAAQAIGADEPNRMVVVGLSAMTGPTVLSVTIGGVVATLAIEALGAGGVTASLWYAKGVVGTTADVVVTYSALSNRTVCGVWAVGTNAVAPNAVAESGAAPASAIIDIPAGGVAIGFAVDQQNGLGDYVWTGFIEDYDEDFPTEIYGHSGASIASAMGQVGFPVTVTYLIAHISGGMVAVSFGPA